MPTAVSTTYVCSHYVAPHAVSQFRERYGHAQTAHLDDWAVRNAIDRKVCSVGLEEPVYEMIDGVPLATYLSQLDTEPELYALLRKNQRGPSSSRGPDGGYEYAIITVLTGEMVRGHMGSGRWRKSPEAFAKSAMTTSLATKLAGVQVVQSAPAKKPPFHEALRAARVKHGISKSELARKVEASTATSIDNWEAGKGMAEKSYERLCSALPELREAEPPRVFPTKRGAARQPRGAQVQARPQSRPQPEHAAPTVAAPPARRNQLMLIHSVKTSPTYADFMALLSSAPEMTAREIVEVLS